MITGSIARNGTRFTGNQTEPNFRGFGSMARLKLSTTEKRILTVQSLKPSGIPVLCNITIDRGVVVGYLDVYLMSTALQYGGNLLTTIGSIVSLWHGRKILDYDEFKLEPFPVHLRRNESDGCRGNNCTTYEMMWLPASTFGTSVPYERHTTQHYSIFAKWNFEKIPGIDSLMMKLRESGSHLENVSKELSPSNIAILSLPLLMAMLLISFFQEVSTAATA